MFEGWLQARQQVRDEQRAAPAAPHEDVHTHRQGRQGGGLRYVTYVYYKKIKEP